jgi:glycosyltransferase involved in cell wall biosynthesis
VSERPLRVLHCPAVVGGHSAGLARAERALGLDSRAIGFEPPPFGYEVDEVLFQGGSPVGRELRRLRFLARTLREADVVHFNFGTSILPRYWPSAHGAGVRRVYGLYARLLEGRDLPWLRRAGKAVFVTFQGDDVRRAASLRTRLPEGHAAWVDDYYDPRDDERKRLFAARVGRYAHGILALNPDLLELLPPRAEFLPYAHVDPAVWTPVQASNSRPVVAHAPTDRRVKGTDALVAAVERLRSEGVDVELRLVEGLPRDGARRALAGADVVVDQLLTGWYGGVAVEAMALGKPVVARLHEPDLARIPEAMRDELPVVHATPDTIADFLRGLLGGPRDEIGRRSRAYVERWHDPRRIAAHLCAAYESAASSRRSPSTSTRSTAGG